MRSRTAPRRSRGACAATVAEYAFQHAAKSGATVFGGPKYTVSPVYEGMLKEEMDAAARRHPGVPYDPQLIDATYALLLSAAGDAPLVIPALNRDGDCLSDLVMQLFGSIAGAESVVLAFDENLAPSAIMAEAPHGTAPRLEGKNVANPLAMILAPPPCSLTSTIRAPSPPRARSTMPRWPLSPRASPPPTSAATPRRPSSPTPSSPACHCE